MDQLRFEFRTTRGFGVSHRPEPVQDRRSHRIGVRVALQMRVEPLPHDEVRNAVAINIGEGRGVRFGECGIAGIVGR